MSSQAFSMHGSTEKLRFKADPILTCLLHSPRAGCQVYALTVESHLAGDAGTWGTAPAVPLGCPAAEQLSDKPMCQPSSAPAPRLHNFILLEQYVYIYTT